MFIDTVLSYGKNTHSPALPRTQSDSSSGSNSSSSSTPSPTNKYVRIHPSQNYHPNTITVSRSGNTPILIRYTHQHSIIYLSAEDTIDPFLVSANTTFQKFWDTSIPQEIKAVLQANMHLLTLWDPHKGNKLEPTITFTKNDMIKLILCLPLPFQERSMSLDLFLLYYKTHFKYKHKMKKSPMERFCIRYHNGLLFLSLVVGFLLAVFTFNTLHMLKV